MSGSLINSAFPKEELRRIVLVSFSLGTLFGVSCSGILYACLLIKSVEIFSLSLYVIIGHVGFHLAEFLVALLCRPAVLNEDSFLVFLSKQYTVMSVIPFLEYFVKIIALNGSISFFPLPFKLNFIQCSVFGVLTICFYAIRVIGMIQCGTNFCLFIEVKKRKDHQLVKHGVYSVLRHPSYFGFFWRSLFLQLIVGNCLSFMVHTCVLWNFFRRRIEYEETILESEDFFGKNYKAYKTYTWVGIPFVA